MNQIAYSKYYVINTVEDKMDIYDNVDHLELLKVETRNNVLSLENGVVIRGNDDHGDFHFFGGTTGEYDIYFEVFLVELKEGEYDPEFDEVIDDRLYVRNQKKIGFIKSCHQIIYND